MNTFASKGLPRYPGVRPTLTASGESRPGPGEGPAVLIVGTFAAIGALMVASLRLARRRARAGRAAAGLVAALVAVGTVLVVTPASAAIVAPIPMGTTVDFSVLAATTV